MHQFWSLPATAPLLLVTLYYMGVSSSASPAPIYEWTSLNYTWPSYADQTAALQNKSWIPNQNLIAGLKHYMGQYYVTVPRLFAGVPATLARVSGTCISPGTGCLLDPFPSWAWNSLDNPIGLKHVQSMEIDTQGRMWVIDVGRVNMNDPTVPVVNGPARLLIWDLTRNVLAREYYFPESVASATANFLNDIVLDTERGFAYISDAHGPGNLGGIIIYDFSFNTARRFYHASMNAVSSEYPVINGYEFVSIQVPVDGIALTPKGTTLYYCALTGLGLFSIETRLLRDWSLSDDTLSLYVKTVGQRESQADGMAFDADGRLYLGQLSHSGLVSWTPGTALSTSTAVLPRNYSTLNWVDTFAFDNDAKALLFTSNRLATFFNGTMDFTGAQGANMRVFSVPIGSTSYLTTFGAYGALTCITPDEVQTNHRIKTALIVVGVVFWVVLLALCLTCVRLKRQARAPGLPAFSEGVDDLSLNSVESKYGTVF